MDRFIGLFVDGAVTQEQYDTCIQANDQASCLAAGGEWRVIAGAVVEGCHCPTGQGDKRCTSLADCLSECLADPKDALMNCDGIVEGRCSDSSIVLGCHCYFDEEGRVSGKCLS